MHACTELFAAALKWCEMLTQTQRLLLPTSVVVVTLLWTKMCPTQSTPNCNADEDEAIYLAAITRWAAAKDAEQKQAVRQPDQPGYWPMT